MRYVLASHNGYIVIINLHTKYIESLSNKDSTYYQNITREGNKITWGSKTTWFDILTESDEPITAETHPELLL